MGLDITKKNRVICEECGNADGTTAFFAASNKTDNRLSKDNLKFYKVKWLYGGKNEYDYPTITLKVDDVVITEALGIDITYEGRDYKIFDTNYIVAKVKQ